MEHTTPNSGPEKGENYFKQQSPDIGPDDNDEQSFPQIEFIYNTAKIWEGPRYPAYNSKAARLESYTGWPHGLNPSPSSLSTAGFYFLGKRPVIEKKFKNTILFNIITQTYTNPTLFQVKVI